MNGKSIENIELNKNLTETISTDIEKLGKILNFKKYRPIKVKFKYVFIDNSGKNERMSIPGPSDHYLEALLEFDSITFVEMNDFEKNLEWIEQNHKREEFDFDWLTLNVKKELENSRPNYNGHPDFFFGTGANGKSWYLNNKILIKKETN